MLRTRNGPYKCAICGHGYAKQAEAEACGERSVRPPTLSPGKRVRSNFFSRLFPDRPENDNCFEVTAVNTGLAPSFMDGAHARIITAKMVADPLVVRDFHEEEVTERA